MGDLSFGAGPFVDGEQYDGSNGLTYTYENGCFLLPMPEYTDTVDGYALQGVSDGTAIDADGNAIPDGAPIITFLDANGEVINSKDCTDLDTNTFSIALPATEAGTDSAGNDYEADDMLLYTPGGQVFCQQKTADTDTFTTLIVAGADGTDDAGNEYVQSDALLMLPSGQLVCASKTIDTDTVDGYAVQGVSDGTQLDAAGNPIPADAQIITFFDGNGDVINSKDCTDIDTDTFVIAAAATEAGTDDAGNDYEIGDILLQTPGGEVFCQNKTVDTDTFATLIVAGEAGTDDAGNEYNASDSLIQLAGGQLVCATKVIDTDTVDGYALQGVSDGSQLDAAGNPIPADSPIITFFDSDGNAINSKDCTDKFGVIMTATEEFTDTAGNTVAVDDQYFLLADGSTVCAEKPVFEDTDTQDGYALLGTSDGTQLDQSGNAIPADAEIITFYDAAGVELYSKDCTDDDTFGVPSEAGADVVDFLGNPVPEGNQIITFPGDIVVCLPRKLEALKIFPIVMGCYQCGDAGLVVTDGSKPAYLGQTVQPSQWELTDGTNTVTGSGNTTLDYSTLDIIGPWTLTQSTQANDDPECVQSCSKQIPSCVEIEQFCGLLPGQEEATNPSVTDNWVDNNDGTFTTTFPITGMVVTWGISRVECVGTTQPISNCDPNTWTHSSPNAPNPQQISLTEGVNAFAETGAAVWPLESGVEYDAFFRIDALPDKSSDSCEGEFALVASLNGLGVGFREDNTSFYYTSVSDIQTTAGIFALNPTTNLYELSPGEWTVDNTQAPPEGGISFTWESFAIGDVLSYSGTAFRSDAMAMRLISTTCRQAVCADVVGGEVLSAIDGQGEAVEDLSTIELGELK